jgi:hypothetical protein
MSGPVKLISAPGSVRDHLLAIAEAASHGWPGGLIERFVLRNGRFFKAAAFTGAARGKQGQCFKNAMELALHNPRLSYVEGFGGSIIPVHHAWCADADGNVIDPTWDRPEDRDYFGIAFEAHTAWEHAVEHGYYGLFDGPRGINLPLLEKLDPDLIREIKEAHRA